MKRMLPIILLLLLFCGCHPSDVIDTDILTTDEPTNEATPTPMSVTPTPAPLHSEFYMDGVSVEDVILYFNEVCLDAEFTDGGDPSRIQKWNSPIYYYVYGTPTEDDILKLEELVLWLNEIKGFPGMHETEKASDANLKIHFCDYDTMISLLGDNFHGMDAGVTFWYDYDVIYDEIICIRTDLNQTLRNSVIFEELYNGLGPVQDTDLRPDSVIYSEYSEPQALTPMDKLLLKLLYHPDIQCGMDSAACEAVIRQLYY